MIDIFYEQWYNIIRFSEFEYVPGAGRQLEVCLDFGLVHN